MSHLNPEQASLIFRFGGTALIILFAVWSIGQQRKRRAQLESVWRGLADETGGVYSREKLGIENNQWVGGPTVRWTIRGVPVMLSSHRQNRNSAGTWLRAPIQLSRPFQFHVMTPSAPATSS